MGSEYDRRQTFATIAASLGVVIPKTFVGATLTTVVFIWKYYRAKCTMTEDGSYVSNPLSLPDEADYTFTQMFLDSFTIGWSFQPVNIIWRMPRMHDEA